MNHEDRERKALHDAMIAFALAVLATCVVAASAYQLITRS